MEIEMVLTSASAAALVLEFLKRVIRRWIVKDPNFDFPQAFYLISLPVLNLLVIPGLALLGLEGYLMPTDWVAFARLVVIALLNSAVSVLVYQGGIKPLKEYGKP